MRSSPFLLSSRAKSTEGKEKRNRPLSKESLFEIRTILKRTLKKT